MTINVKLSSLAPADSVPAGAAVLLSVPGSSGKTFGALDPSVLATTAALTAEATARTSAGYLLPPAIPAAANALLGGSGVAGAASPVGLGTGFSIVSGSLTFTMPLATVGIAGAVRPDGTTITILNGVISATTGGAGTITGVTAGTGLTGGGTTGSVTLAVSYGTTSLTAAAGNDTRIVNAVQQTGATMTGTLTLAATAAAGDNSLKAASTAYADRAFSSVSPGAVPASGGGTTNFLRADGAFAAPPGGGAGPFTKTVYTSAGAISVLDDLAIVNLASAGTMTLSNSATDNKVIRIKRWNAAVSLTATIDGTSQTISMFSTGTLKDEITLRMDTTSSVAPTWIAE